MITIDPTLCTGCGLCLSDCFFGHLHLEKGKARPREGHCMACGHCVAICPAGAVSMSGFDPADVRPIPSTLFHDFTPEKCLDFLRFRRSVRQFTDQSIAPEILSALAEAGRYSPTGSNLQELHFTFVTDQLSALKTLAITAIDQMSRMDVKARYKDALEGIVAAHRQGGDRLFHGAPTVLVISTPLPQSIDTGIAASRMELLANTYGLGACYIGFFVQACAIDSKLQDFLQIPTANTVTAALALGYPQVRYQRTVPRNPAQVNYL